MSTALTLTSLLLGVAVIIFLVVVIAKLMELNRIKHRRVAPSVTSTGSGNNQSSDETQSQQLSFDSVGISLVEGFTEHSGSLRQLYPNITIMATEANPEPIPTVMRNPEELSRCSSITDNLDLDMCGEFQVSEIRRLSRQIDLDI